MPLTSKDRSRRWKERQKENPERHKNYLEKERERYRKRKKNNGEMIVRKERKGVNGKPGERIKKQKY